MADPAAVTEAPAAPQPKRNMLGALVALNLLLGVGTLGFLGWFVTRPPPAAAATPAAGADAKPAEEGAGHAAAPAAEGHGPPAAPGAEPAAGHGGGGTPARINSPGATVPLGDFVVRLPGSDGDRYARFAFEVLVRTTDEAEMIKQRLPEIRDRFIMVLAELTLDGVRGKAELDNVKGRLMKELQATAAGDVVRSLYVTEFVVQ
jgi:flagellar basal body-associated protein FliL